MDRVCRPSAETVSCAGPTNCAQGNKRKWDALQHTQKVRLVPGFWVLFFYFPCLLAFTGFLDSATHHTAQANQLFFPIRKWIASD